MEEQHRGDGSEQTLISSIDDKKVPFEDLISELRY